MDSRCKGPGAGQHGRAAGVFGAGLGKLVNVLDLHALAQWEKRLKQKRKQKRLYVLKTSLRHHEETMEEV